MGKWRIVERSIEILRDVDYFSCNTNELITKFYGVELNKLFFRTKIINSMRISRIIPRSTTVENVERGKQIENGIRNAIVRDDKLAYKSTRETKLYSFRRMEKRGRRIM